MAIATGAMGMSVNDFCSLSPSEFRAVYDVYMAKEQTTVRNGWEQARLIAMCSLQPYSKKTLRPTDVVRFDWDEDKKKTAPMSAKATLERMESASKMYASIQNGNPGGPILPKSSSNVKTAMTINSVLVPPI